MYPNESIWNNYKIVAAYPKRAHECYIQKCISIPQQYEVRLFAKHFILIDLTFGKLNINTNKLYIWINPSYDQLPVAPMPPF